MEDKQLNLDQRTLSQVTEMEEVSSGEEVEYLLEAISDVTSGTTQDTISDTSQALADPATRYLSETGRSYDDITQDTLVSDTPTEPEQAEISDYSAPRVASD